MRTPVEFIDEAIQHAHDVYNAVYRGADAEARRSEILAIVKGLAAVASAIESLATPSVPPEAGT